MKAARGSQSIVTVIAPTRGWVRIGLPDLWRHRELLSTFVARDVRVRYKQTVLGMLWAVLQPFAAMVVFTIFLGNLAKVPSDGLPYPVFAYSGLLIWLYFADSLDRASRSLVTNNMLVSKVYFPRLVAPLAGVVSPLLDFAIAMAILFGLILWYGVSISASILLIPVFVLMAVVCAAAFGTLLSALYVEYRDLTYAVPMMIQLWLFATPVVYPASLVAPRWRLLYSINPMVGTVMGFRWAVLGRGDVDWRAISISAAVAVGVLTISVAYFRRVEQTFADSI